MCHQLLKNDQCILCETENLVFITIQLHPPQILQSRFTSIKLFFLYNSSCFISTLCSHDPPSPCLLLGKSITGAQFYLVWRLKGAPQIIQLWWVSLRGSFVLYSSKIWYFFFYLTELQTGFTSTFIHCMCQVPPSHFQTTEDIWH